MVQPLKSLALRLQLAGVVLAAACHPRVDAQAEEHRDPVPLCAIQRVARDRIEGSKLVLEQTVRDICSPDEARTFELARVDLEVTPSCPAGQVLLEVGGGERILLPTFAARLDRRTMSELSRALADFSTSSGMSYGRAFIVSCTEPRWLFFATGAGDPRAQLYSVSPAPHAEAEPAADGPREGPPPRDALLTGTCPAPLDLGANVWVGRALSAGVLPGPSSLTTWTLGRTGSAARLLIQEFRAVKKGGPPENEQPEGTWTCIGSTAWEGSVRGSPLRFSLSQGPTGQRLELSCSSRTVAIAAADARRVRVPSSREGCNASRWVPASRRQLQVLVCVNPADVADPAPFFLAERPGVEHVTYDNDDCGNEAAALRSVPRDGGVSTAVKISEQPEGSVPAGLRRKP